MRLNKYLALCGLGSRRKCDDLISGKRISINGNLIDDFSYKVKPNDIVQYKNSIITPNEDYRFYLLNKPSGYVCSSSTKEGKRVIDLIPTKRRLFTIGRLDRDTTGAILLTDNGDFANKIMHPRYGVEKVYIVETKIDVKKDLYEKFKIGIDIGRGEVAKGQIKRLKKKNGLIFWEVKIKEGKNREIKRLYKAMGSIVIKLHRYSIAGFNVKNIKIGSFTMLNKKQINSLV